MSRKDRTGPMGMRAMAGRGLGACTGVNAPVYGGSGRGCGRGFGRGVGRGSGQGFGRSFRFGSNAYFNQPASKEFLQAQKVRLENMLDAVNKKIESHNYKTTARGPYFFDRGKEGHMVYIDENCIGCGVCVDTCPVEAISLLENRAVINKDLCIECGACIDVCPLEAIHRQD